MATPRAGHVEAPQLPQGTLSIDSPPNVIEPEGFGGTIAMAVPMLGSMGVMIFMAFSNNANPRMMLMAGVMIIAMIAMVGFTTYRQIAQHRKKVTNQRREYLAYLDELRTDARQARADQQTFAEWHMPSPSSLGMIIQQNERLWERKEVTDTTFTTRLGTGNEPLCLNIDEPELSPVNETDPVCLSALTRFVSTYETVEDIATGVSLANYSRVDIAGEIEARRGLLRSIVLLLSTLLSPKLLRVALVTDSDGLRDWDWLKWLPHARSDQEDAVGTMRLMGGTLAEVLDLLPFKVEQRAPFVHSAEKIATPLLLVVTDGVKLTEEQRTLLQRDGVCHINLADGYPELRDYSSLRLDLQSRADGRSDLEMTTLREQISDIVADYMSVEMATSTARRLTKYESTPNSKSSGAPGKASGPSSDPARQEDLTDLLGIGDIRDFDPDIQITRRTGEARLNVPFGVTPEGVPVNLDIKEAALGGMGPHGLLIGATGSGKSEVLRTMVMAMVLTHSPEQLNLVLVDFKGGATFAGMSELPHVSATITNLEAELHLVDRMEEALHGEMVRRQELLRAAGNYSNVGDYEQARLEGHHQHPALPALFIILDEFSELLSAKPEFIDTFVTIGRLGRSLEIHLLLATQKLEEGRLRGLDSHLSYRIGLRTFSEQDSRAVLGVKDAYALPTVPGVGFLKTGGEDMIQFRASYVAAPPPARRAPAAGVTGAGSTQAPQSSAAQLLPFTVAPVLSLQTTSRQDPVPAAAPQQEVIAPQDAQWRNKSQLDIAVTKLSGLQPQAHEVWLKPLEKPDTLDSLFGDLTVTEERGLHSPSWAGRGGLVFPLGVQDIPREQRRELLEIDLSGAGGHMLVLGAQQSGKSTTLRSIVMALSLINTPQQAQFYIMDFGGGTFSAFRHGAHIAGVATRDRPEVITRMVQEITGIMAQRERYFRQHDIDSIDAYRRGRAEGRYDDGYGEIFLVVDGWANLKTAVPDLDRTLEGLMGRALALGVHFIVGTPRFADVRISMQASFGTLFEHRLGEPRESEIDRSRARTVPENKPGQGLAQSHHLTLIGLPRIDADQDPATTGDGVNNALTVITDSWTGESGPKLRLLPDKLTLDEVRELAPDAPNALIGIDQATLGPVALNFNMINHAYLFGDSRMGKTTFLRTIAQEVIRTHRPPEAQFFLVDPRRTLLQEIPEIYLAGYYAEHQVMTEAMQEVRQFLSQRLPGADITPQQLRERSWWEGPEIFILVDDYDLVNTTRGNPMDPIVDLLPQARDIGLHVIVTRRSGGASRALYDPLIRSIIDLGSPALLLPGDPEEGPLVGKVRPQPGPAGRAQFITRERGHMVIQLAESESVLDRSADKSL